MSEARQFQHIGQRTIRPDGFDKVTGRANYGADFSLPGMVWGKILRSPYAHAKITKLDVSKAEAHPDVLAVATHQDLPSVNAEAFAAGETAMDVLDLARNVLADQKVLYHGHAIAAVAAKTETAAEVALDLIEIEYLTIQILNVEVLDQANKLLLFDGKRVRRHHAIVRGVLAGLLARPHLLLNLMVHLEADH